MQAKKRRRPRAGAGPLARLGIAAGFLTAEERARAAGCSKTHMNHIERGSLLPGLDLCARMGTVYGVRPERIESAARECVRLREKRGAKP